MTHSTTRTNWNGANAQRSAAGAATQVARIRVIMNYLHPATTPREVECARLRLRHPKWTLREIAEKNGMTKDAYWSTLNRFLNRPHPIPDDEE